MNCSRRWFIGGAASFGAFQGCRFLPSPFDLGSTPQIRFGVVSDIHVIAENVDRDSCGNTRTFRRALKWFDRQGVDAVLLPGDMADAGLVSQLQCVADAWNAVFPDGKSRLDGRKVERVFVYGNHDWEGFGYGYKVFGGPSKELVNDMIQKVGMKRAWEEVFEEDYAPVYRKTVKGFDFIGAHWDPSGNGCDWKHGPQIDAFFAERCRDLDPERPFFYLQHPHPKDTCYGPWAWGHDDGSSTRLLSRFANAVAFSGHSHYSLVDERTVWQGAFTSIGSGSLRYYGAPGNEFPDFAFENAGWGDTRRKTEELMLPHYERWNERNGLLVSVYADRMTVARRDFLRDARLGPDWVMPLPAAESKPFAFAERARRHPSVEFPEKAVLRVEKGEVTPMKGTKTVPAHVVVIPAAVQTDGVRVYRYELKVVRADGSEVLRRHVLTPDSSLPADCLVKEVSLPVADSCLPKGEKLTFSVEPVNCFGRRGKAIELVVGC